jgi:putative chitinase
VNPEIFFDKVRASVFGGRLVPSQVDGLNRIIAEADKRGVNNEYLAYTLATSAWEGAYTMQPITERGQRSYFNKYEPGTKIGKVLGNTQPGDGYRFRGRGDVMLTGRANYAKAGRILGIDLLGNPELALDPKVSVRILFSGMADGWFTGKDLDDFLDGIDEGEAEDLREFANARRIINGTDKQVQIAKIALAFEGALRAAKRPERGSPVAPAPTPVPEAPTPPKATPEAPEAAPEEDLIVRILRIIRKLLIAFVKGGRK